MKTSISKSTLFWLWFILFLSLGAVHDGQNVCLAADSFIMAPSSGLSTDETAQNPWYFSPCSVSEFRKQIETLDKYVNLEHNIK